MPSSMNGLAISPPSSQQMTQDVAILDFPMSGKFGYTGPGRSSSKPSSSSIHSDSSSEGDDDDISSGNDQDEKLDAFNEASRTPKYHRVKSQPSVPQPVQPRFSRALTMPLSSQLSSHLQHPHRLNGALVPSPQQQADSPEWIQFGELSLELADSVQAMIQNMLQISPPHILEPAKEQVSACSFTVPTPSMSAMFTAMKNLNYISANMATFCASGPEDSSQEYGSHNDFDIGEVLQNVGDVLSGAAAHVGVELVLYHGDIGLKHIWVKGDEGGMSYLLSHVARQVLATARRGDSIEIGLQVVSLPRKPQPQPSVPLSDEEYCLTASPVSNEDSLLCTVEILHKYSSSSLSTSRENPVLSSVMLRRLVKRVGATLTSELSAESTGNGWSCELNFTLDRGSTPSPTPATFGPDERLACEPTIDQLIAFADTLRGKKVTLYADSKGSFAHHLSSYLTAWGMDVSHGDTEGSIEAVVESSPVMSSRIAEGLPTAGPSVRQERQPTTRPSFMFIDDDVDILQQRLNDLRSEQSPQFNIRKRPSLATNRAISSPQVPRARGQSNPLNSSVVIVHFASLSNFKIIKDVIQSVLASYSGSPIPEVMIIPKPAGPRRLLTALHTALTKPAVDPFFSPIATSPSTPGNLHPGSFMNGHSSSTNSPKSPFPNRPSGSRSNSDRSTRSTTKDILEHNNNLPPPSPLGMSDNVEYFSEAALGMSPSSGYVIQSPDGKPTGIFFHPNPRSTIPRVPSVGHRMERDRGQSLSTISHLPSRSATGDMSPMSFSSLHSAANTPRAMPRKISSSAVPLPKSPMEPSTTIPGVSTTIPSPPNTPIAKTHPAIRNVRTPSVSKTPAKGKAAEANLVPPVSVLIVDDNPINQSVLSTFMRRKKIKYAVASDGAEAVEKWRTGEFHLILMDIQMPIMDGIEATKEIRRLEKSNASAGYPPLSDGGSPMRTPSESSDKMSPYRSSVIIVALTASSLQSDRVAALAAGCNDFLTKPVSLLWLNNKITEWGSIKALQMWADPGPELAQTQTTKAKVVADRLHVPERKLSPSRPPNAESSPKTAVPPPILDPSSLLEPPSSDLLPSAAIPSGTSSAFWSEGQPSPPTFWATMGVASPNVDANRDDIRDKGEASSTMPGSTEDLKSAPDEVREPTGQ
ncbi:hypothetical protein C8J56DRAFT_540819 [Mycena floridula]|nr:hypothetical protein C8J56DRAFT_540819 [Mycena floridula]